MTWILQQLHYTQPWASERGGVEGVLGPSLLLKFEQKRLFAFSKKVFCEVSSWKMKFHRFCSPYENPWLHLENSIIANTLARTVWLIMDNCWTRVFWSGSTNICNRLSKNFRWLALKYCFELDIKSLIDLKIFCTTFGIGGGNCPHCLHLATRLQWSRRNHGVAIIDYFISGSTNKASWCNKTKKRFWLIVSIS